MLSKGTDLIGAVKPEQSPDSSKTILNDDSSFDPSLLEHDVEQLLERSFESDDLLEVGVGDGEVVKEKKSLCSSRNVRNDQSVVSSSSFLILLLLPISSPPSLPPAPLLHDKKDVQTHHS